MLKKFNIAFLPTTKNPTIIQCAQFFSSIADGYQLGDHSLPHVTLCQFYTDENEIKNIWTRVLPSIKNHTIELQFKEISCVTFDGSLYWVALIPDQKALLIHLHDVVTNVAPISHTRPYDPHMTLINTRTFTCRNMAARLSESYIPIADKFVLSIGECDEIGQFTHVVFIKQ